MKKILLLVFLMPMAMVGCDSDSGSDDETYAYQFVINGCDTGKKAFNGKAAFCSALKNHNLNNGCAFDARKEAYEKRCGQDWSLTNVHGDVSTVFAGRATCPMETREFASRSDACDYATLALENPNCRSSNLVQQVQDFCH